MPLQRRGCRPADRAPKCRDAPLWSTYAPGERTRAVESDVVLRLNQFVRRAVVQVSVLERTAALGRSAGALDGALGRGVDACDARHEVRLRDGDADRAGVLAVDTVDRS